ncbi:hypothetical protein [Polyangium mundeleinium]|uniref:Uncharacterized protein n=1 Tax=Polyangium mundeleinium TaxID=2995306 RepID=A0ABT5EF38_9BACT|nr:hypothetical protein [Polyangium mundeleinium]MDC0740391.1 hypothetical protein [Polyangium mundeleinium]
MQLRLTAAETTFEGWVKTLLGVDPEKNSRASLFASFSLAGFLPQTWESSEVLAKAQLDGWGRLSRAIDASKIAAGTPRHEAPPSIKPGLGTTALPFKLTIAFAVALPSALAGMLLGHLGAGIASAQTAGAPSLHATTPQVSMIANAFVKNPLSGDFATPSAVPLPSEQAPTARLKDEDHEVPLLSQTRALLKDKNPRAALDTLKEHARLFPKSTHADECANLKRIAEKNLASMTAKEATKTQAAIKEEDKPKP